MRLVAYRQNFLQIDALEKLDRALIAEQQSGEIYSRFTVWDFATLRDSRHSQRVIERPTQRSYWDGKEFGSAANHEEFEYLFRSWRECITFNLDAVERKALSLVENTSIPAVRGDNSRVWAGRSDINHNGLVMGSREHAHI